MSPLHQGETLLMSAGYWQLRGTNDRAKQWNDGLDSYIVHCCPKASDSGDRWWWTISGIDDDCTMCGEYPPKDMLGLYKLHNFDWLQKETK